MRPGNRTVLAALLPLTLLSFAAGAQQQVYKSVDAQGNVTYSSTPPAPDAAKAVEQVPIAPPPPEAERKAAEQRLRAIEKESALRDKRRSEAKQDTPTSVEAAQQALDEARLALEQAKIMAPGDWQTIATGGRVPKQSYLNRVQRAEARAKSAEDALRKARRGR